MEEKSSKNIAGFTLIETLVYVSLFAIIIGGALTGVHQIIENSEKNKSKNNFQEEANFVMRKMNWVLTNISSIDLPLAGSSGNVLKINKLNFAQNPIEISLDSGNLELKRNGGLTLPLNSPAFPVSSLNFDHIAANGTKPAMIIVNFLANGQIFELIKYLK